MQQLFGYVMLGLRLLPWLGAVGGLVLIVVSTIRTEPWYLSQRVLQPLGIGLLGVAIGLLASGF